MAAAKYLDHPLLLFLGLSRELDWKMNSLDSNRCPHGMPMLQAPASDSGSFKRNGERQKEQPRKQAQNKDKG